MVDLQGALRAARPAPCAPTNCRTSCRCSWNSSRRCRRAEACELLGQTAHILAALAERLRKKRSRPIEAVFRALVAMLGGASRRREVVAALLQEPDADPDDLAALDAAWEEEAVTLRPRRGAMRQGRPAAMGGA